MTELLLATPRAIVFHGRWQDVLPLVAAARRRIDVTITDPPYTPHVHANATNTVNGKWTPTPVQFAALTSLEHVPAFLGATRRWVLCCCALEQFGDYERAAGGRRTSKTPTGQYARSWLWRKLNTMGQGSMDRPANSCEGIAVMHRPGPMHWNGRGSHAWLDLSGGEEFPESVDNCCIFGRGKGWKKSHPTQKPEALCRHLVEKFSDVGECVADWYCGSGAISAAALALGRTTIACDEDREWAEFTAARLRGLL